MTEVEINQIFKDFHNEFKYYQDSGNSELTFLSLCIKRMNETDKKTVIDYCLDESRILLSLDLLKKLNDKSVIDPLYVLFDKFYKNKNENTNKILPVLFKLKDTNPKHIEQYSRFLNEEIESKGLFGTNFHLNADYLFVNKEHTLDILSDYYSHLTDTDTRIINFLENCIVDLVYRFENTTFDNMNQLIKLTSVKNKEAGRILKKLFYEYSKSNLCNKKEETLIISYLDPS